MELELTDRYVQRFEVFGGIEDFEDATYVGMGKRSWICLQGVWAELSALISAAVCCSGMNLNMITLPIVNNINVD